MTDKRIKSYLEDRLKRLESIRNERGFTTAELGDIACCKQTLAFINSLQEAPVELKEVNLEDAKKEELAQKYVDYTFKRHNIDANSKEGQLIYYAYMHGMNQCLEQLKAQKGE